MTTTEQTSLSFELTENQKMVQQLARNFAEKEIKPVIAKFDESQEFPHDIVKNMAELGFLELFSRKNTAEPVSDI
jgi:alkylation response protein AidB-like acyl-CoA dehydrogenase